MKKTSYNTLIGLLAASTAFAAPKSAPDLTETKKSITVVEELIHKEKHLHALDQEINKLNKRIENTIQDKETLKIFKAQQSFWMRERHTAQNQDSSKADYLKAVRTELKKTMSARVKTLQQIMGNPKLITKNASDYQHVDAWYLKKFQEAFIGKQVSVWGDLRVPDLEKSNYGSLTNSGHDGLKLDVLFGKKLSEISLDRFFTKNRAVSSHHSGKVVKKEGVTYLMMTALMGGQL